MELQPRLIEVSLPERPAGIVLVLHGGASRRGSMRVSPTQLSVLRMIPIAQRISALSRTELAVFRVLNTTRGWGTGHTPADDARWALRRACERLERRLPACLVGHSLGGRAALLTAGHPEVHSVVALAPWVYPTDAVSGVDGKPILVVHGDADRIASPERSEALARRLGDSADVGYISVRGGTHSMLRRHRLFDSLAAEFAAATLLGSPTDGPIGRVRNGESFIEV
ncbi:MAG: alpha/beta fold hydrolase [Solirubrobacteraceae bacterium]